MKIKFTALFILIAILVLTSCPSPTSTIENPPTTDTYTVTYEGNGNTAGIVPVDSTAYTSGADVTILGNTGTLEKTGKNFVGWTEASDGSGTLYTATLTFIISRDTTLYAKWETIEDLTVIYEGNGNTVGLVPVDSATYTFGADVTILGNTGTLENGTEKFIGWTEASDGSGTIYSTPQTFTITEDTTFYAKWTTEATYSVTYNSNSPTSGTAPTDSNIYISGQNAPILNNSGTLLKDGFVFSGWNTANDGTGTTYQAGENVTIIGNTELFALWIPVYTLTYNGNTNDSGSVPVDGNAYRSGESVIILGNTGNLIKSGFSFNGWNTAANGSGTTYQLGESVTITDNTELYAIWTTAIYITYNGNTNDSGSVPVDGTPYLSGESVLLLDNTGNLEKTYNEFAGWNTQADGLGTSYQPGASLTITANTTLFAIWTSDRIFNAINSTDSSWYTTNTHLMAIGDHCLVYVETTSTFTANAQAIADEFDNNIYDMMNTNFGAESDVDSNGKVILLFLDILDGYSGSGGYVGGYFHPTHEYSTATYANSNEADMLFLDTYPAEPGSDSSFTTIAHEFQHLINFSNTALVDGTQQDLWINEGLSSGAEYLYAGAQIQWKIDYFNNDPVGTIANGNNFFVWNGYWESPAGGEDILADYSTVYLFFQWLQLHASNGTGIYKDILSSNFRDYQAVTTSASNRINSQFSSWSNLLRTWMMANILGQPTGYKGYNNAIAAAASGYASASNADYPFSPGEGIISAMPVAGENTPPAGSGTNIEYIGINFTTGADDRTAPYEGDISLVYNGNTDYTGDDETGYIANIEQTGRLSSILPSIAAINPIPTSYPVDIQLIPEGGFSDNSHRPVTGKSFSGKLKGSK